jgi:class 3 adenylate cyclase
VSELLWFNLEVMLLSVGLVVFFVLRRWLSASPLYLAIGMITTFILISSRLRLAVPVLGGGETSYSIAHLALILAAVAMVYTLRGTAAAQRLIGGICVASALLLVLKLLVAARLNEVGIDVTLFGRSDWTNPSVWGGFVSTLAFLLDGLVILVVYQLFHNWLPKWPIFVAMTPALVAAMMADGMVFGGLYEMAHWEVLRVTLVGNVTAAVAAAVPISGYIGWELRRRERAGEEGTLRRGVFAVLDVMSLRKELERTRQALAQTKEDFSHVKSAFSRYTAPDVVEEIVRNRSQLKLGGEERVVTILFSDIRGYSTLSEQMAPSMIITLLNQYFGEMSQILDRERGTIIEFEGDAILAVFGAPLPQADHAVRAVRSALAMLEGVESLNTRWEADGTAAYWHGVGLPSFKIRIGIHTGAVVVGNVGGEKRTKYAVIGDTVNTASRVEGLNKELHTNLLLTESTAAAIRDYGFQLTDMGAHQVKGRVESVQVYTVDGLPTSRDNNTEDAMAISWSDEQM